MHLDQNFLEIKRILDGDEIFCDYHFVDDGSKDHTWQVIESLSKEFEQVSGIKFARNFGKEIALRAGIETVDADLYLTMDSDLQHPPRYVKEMLKLMEDSDADIIDGVKDL